MMNHLNKLPRTRTMTQDLLEKLAIARVAAAAAKRDIAAKGNLGKIENLNKKIQKLTVTEPLDQTIRETHAEAPPINEPINEPIKEPVKEPKKPKPVLEESSDDEEEPPPKKKKKKKHKKPIIIRDETSSDSSSDDDNNYIYIKKSKKKKDKFQRIAIPKQAPLPSPPPPPPPPPVQELPVYTIPESNFKRPIRYNPNRRF